jgi:ribosome-associated protein
MSKDENLERSEALVEKIVAICEDVKAVDIKTFNISSCSSVADFYIICTGNSEPHLKAISERLEKNMKDAELAASAIDGGASSQWIVMDFHSVIVHILHPDAREYYNLETLWDTGTNSPETLPWECKEGEILTSERIFRRQ